MRAVLGNRNAVEGRGTGDDVEIVALPKGKRATEVVFPDETSLSEAFQAITHPAGVWAHHATEGSKPAWVASDNDALASVLADHYSCEKRELEEGGGGSSAGAVQAAVMLCFAYVLLALWRLSPYLKTNAGNDFQAAQMGGAASATAVAKWVALTANATAPAAGDTTLTGEITTAGGGLIRKAGTYAHTAAAASYTITTVFTANGTDALPVTIAKRGIFDAASAGNLVFETLLGTTATLSASGDSLTLTDTISL